MRARALLPGLILALAVACAAGPQRPTLRELSLPDLSGAAESVQQQIRDRSAALRSVADRPDAPPELLAAHFGEVGRLLAAAEYYDAAGICFANARALQPREMRWPYFLGHVSRLTNEPVTAAAYFEETLSRARDHVPAMVWLAEMHLASNRPGEARRVLERARALAPESAAVLSGLGRAALALRDHAAAVAHLEAALAREPEANRLRYPLALAYRGLGDTRAAETHLRLRGEGDAFPDDPLLHELTGTLENAAAFETRASRAMAARQWSDAAENLRQAISIAPDNALTRLNLGTALYMQGDGDAALEQYREALRLSPELAKAHFGIGVVLESRGSDMEAIDAFSAAVRHDPGHVDARFSLANALRRNGRAGESLAHYAEVLRNNPTVSQASFGYAMGLVRLGRYQAARDTLEEAVTTYAGQPGFGHALARVLAAAPDARVRDGARAMAIMRELMTSQQTLAMGETMAMVFAELGRFEEAVRWQEDVIAAATEASRGELLPTLNANLQRYRNRQACRAPWADDDPVHRPAPGQ